MNNYFIIGSPGSGKSTLCSKLKKKGYQVVALGTRIREEPKLKEYRDKGVLIPDDLACSLFADEMSKIDLKKPFVIEGFPSTLDQFNWFVQFSKNHNLKIKLIHLDCPKQVAIERIIHRNEQRAEDTLSCATHRLQTYETKTFPILALAGQLYEEELQIYDKRKSRIDF